MLTPWKEIMTNLESILKSRDYFANKVRLSRLWFFQQFCESWTVKKAECWRIDAFELWCLRRLLRVPWTARRSIQSILKEISPECSLKDWCWSRNSITLATWCEELTHLKRPWWWERLKAGGEGDVYRNATHFCVLILYPETSVLWPPDVKNWLIWKDPDAGKDWRREEKGMTEDEMVGWHHWLDGHEFE